MVEKAKVEEACIEAALTTVKQEEEVAAALAKAEILESAAVELESKAGSVGIAGIPHDSREKRTSDYVECHSRMHPNQQTLPHVEPNTAANQPHEVHQALPLHDSEHNPIYMIGDGPNIAPINVKHHTSYSSVHSVDKPAARMHSHSLSPMKGPQPHTIPHSMQAPQSYVPDGMGMNDFAIYVARHELEASGMFKFDDRPDNYWGLKSTFTNAIQGLRLTCTEELDPLARWLGLYSSEQIRTD